MFIQKSWGYAEGRAPGILRIKLCPFHYLPKVEIKSSFLKNFKSSFCSKNFLLWNCESLEYIIKISSSLLRIFNEKIDHNIFRAGLP